MARYSASRWFSRRRRREKKSDVQSTALFVRGRTLRKKATGGRSRVFPSSLERRARCTSPWSKSMRRSRRCSPGPGAQVDDVGQRDASRPRPQSRRPPLARCRKRSRPRTPMRKPRLPWPASASAFRDRNASPRLLRRRSPGATRHGSSRHMRRGNCSASSFM